MQYTVYRELGALEAVSLKKAREALPASATNDDWRAGFGNLAPELSRL